MTEYRRVVDNVEWCVRNHPKRNFAKTNELAMDGHSMGYSGYNHGHSEQDRKWSDFVQHCIYLGLRQRQTES